MSKALVKHQPLTVEQVTALSRDLAKSTLLPAELRGKEANVMFAVMTGAELGLSPMASIRGIHVIDGKPTLAADTMLAVVINSGAAEYFELVESTAKQATYRTKRAGAKAEVVYTYTFEDARAAKLLKPNSGWEKHPKNMLRARCISMLARIVYPDILAGLYAPEEFQVAGNENVADAEFIQSGDVGIKSGIAIEAEYESGDRQPPGDAAGRIEEAYGIAAELDDAGQALLARLYDAKSASELAKAAADIAALKLDKKGAAYHRLLTTYKAANARIEAQAKVAAAPATEAA